MLKRNRGFSLVELIIVIAILAIIMLIAIPNVPQIIQRQRVKADINSAQELGRLVRAWHSDYSTDPLLEDKAKAIPTVGDDDFMPVKYEEIDGIDTYVKKDYKPTSFLDEHGVAVEDQYFGVFFKGTNLCVAILGGDEDGSDITTANVNYDGYTKDGDKHKNSGPVAFVEIEEVEEEEPDPDPVPGG